MPGITRATVEHEAGNSASVIGAFATDGTQVGYTRVVSDKSRFAYLCGVIVAEAHRSRGLGRSMVKYALEHPEFATVTAWALLTRDARGVYAPLGFRPITAPESAPERRMVWRKTPPPSQRHERTPRIQPATLIGVERRAALRNRTLPVELPR